MHYALSLRTFLFTHYFQTGLRIAVGVIALALVSLYWGNLPIAMTVAIGALCTSLMDLPGPLRHKFHEMTASVLVCSFVTLIVSLGAQWPLVLAAMVVLITFFSSMMVVYGRKAMPLQFAALFIMTLSLETALDPHRALIHAALFFAGGAAYLAYALAVAALTQRQTRQQVLAESLYELSRYAEIKSTFYDIHRDLKGLYNDLVRQQIRLAEKQQASRDMILRGDLPADEARLVHVHYGMFDLYELVLSMHTDYALLRQYFPDGPVLPALQRLVRQIAGEIEVIGYAVMRGRTSHSLHDDATALVPLEQELDRLEHAATPHPEAADVLRATLNKMRAVTEMLQRLHRSSGSDAPTPPAVSGADMTPFLTQQRYGMRTLANNMTWQSPIFRFALRVTLAIALGLWVARFLPYQTHGYWIALTIAVILKPSFSMTRQRLTDRIVGTMIGCVLTAGILHVVHAPLILLGFLFLATAAAPAFVTLKYRYTAIAASMQILLLLGLTAPHAGQAVVERLLDTFVGAAIAIGFSYLLPSWETRGLPRLIRAVLQSHGAYIAAADDLLRGTVRDDFVYRLRRKGFMDGLANLSAALMRMLDEPADRHALAGSINRFIVQNYLVVAHLAAIRLLLGREQGHLHRAQIDPLLEDLFRDLDATLGTALQVWTTGGTPSLQEGLDPALNRTATQAEIANAGPVAWQGWDALQRRAMLLRIDARQISALSVAVRRALAEALSA